MGKMDQLLDLLDAWDDLPLLQRPDPAEFCKEQPELLEDFLQILRDRTALGAALTGSSDTALTPQEMMESISPDRYGLLHFHDQGGIGWVYMANDLEVDRKVALKCLQPQAAVDPDARSRFFREAAITSALEHPGVVPVYGVGGNDGDRLPYYAMRFVQGTTMREAIRQLHTGVIEKWTSGSAYKLLRSLINVCDTVSFAHSRRIIHRDLKSANIMLGEYGETLLLDWGLAKQLDDANAERDTEFSKRSLGNDTQVTRSGATVGTVAFMSPEQALGNWSEVDCQSDLFSLGAILYQILTGQVPYQGNQSLLLAQRAEYASPSSVNPNIPKELNAICCKAMQREKSNRYANVEAFKKDLEAFLADEPVLALPDSIYASSQRWLRKHRTLAQSVGIILLGTSLVLAGFLAHISKQNIQLEQLIDSERQAKLEIEDRNVHIQALLVESETEAYQAQMSLVSQAWNAMHPRRFERALENAAPKLGSLIDPRGPEWWIAWHRAFGDLEPTPTAMGDDQIMAMRIVADGQRAAIWRNSQQLSVINLQDGATLFTTPLPYTMHKLLMSYADNIPISEDGSTIAIPNQNAIQLWKWDGQAYVTQEQLVKDDNSLHFRFSNISLSANGETIAARNDHNELSIWRKAKPIRLPWNHQKAVSITVSSDGLMVALLAEKDISVLRLDIERWQTFDEIFERKPTKICFGDLNTLIAWDSQSASTWYISQSSFDAVHLWDYPLPPPPVGASVWNCLREKIDFENGFNIKESKPAPNELVDRDRVRTSTLACMDRTVATVLIREPANSFALLEDLTNPDELKDRIEELHIPHSTQIRSMTFDCTLAAIESDSHQWSVCNFENMLRSWNDPFLRRGPVRQLAWSSEEELVAVSGVAEFPPATVYRPGEMTTPEFAKVKCRPAITNSPSIALKGYQACVSENGEVVASYEQKPGIHIVNTRTGESQKPFQVDSTLTFIGDRAIRMYLWNRWSSERLPQQQDTALDFERVQGQDLKTDLPPLDLPWLLMFQNGSWSDPMSERLEERLRLLVIDYEKKSLVDLLEIDDDNVTAVAIASDGRQLQVATEGKKVHVWEVTDERKIIKKVTLSSPTTVRSLLALRSSEAFWGTENGDILHINDAHQLDLWFASAHDGPIEYLATSPDRKRLITVGGEGVLRMFDVASRREVFSLVMHFRPTCAVFNPQQTSLAVGEESGHIHILPLATSDQVVEFEQKRLRSGLGKQQSDAAISRELWSGRTAALLSDPVVSESVRNTIESLKSEYTQRSVNELRAKVFEAQQFVP